VDSRKSVDPELIRKCQRGSPEAFDELYDSFGDAVWRICSRMAGNTADAEDLAQDVWITVWRQIGSFRCESAFYTWLYRVASNVCLQWLRRAGGKADLPIEESSCEASPGPEQQVIRQESLDRTESALMSLPEPLRLPLVLRVEEEMSYAEIAQVLDCTTSAVKMRICRARTALANALKEEEP